MYQEGISQKQSVCYEKYKSASVQFLTLEWIECPAREEGKITGLGGHLVPLHII